MKLSKLEIRQILYWAESAIDEGMHWGDGVMYLPSEQELIQKLKSAESNIELAQEEINTVFNWLEHYAAETSVFTNEDIILFNKFYKYCQNDTFKSEFLKNLLK